MLRGIEQCELLRQGETSLANWLERKTGVIHNDLYGKTLREARSTCQLCGDPHREAVAPFWIASVADLDMGSTSDASVKRPTGERSPVGSELAADLDGQRAVAGF